MCCCYRWRLVRHFCGFSRDVVKLKRIDGKCSKVYLWTSGRPRQNRGRKPHKMCSKFTPFGPSGQPTPSARAIFPSTQPGTRYRVSLPDRTSSISCGVSCKHRESQLPLDRLSRGPTKEGDTSFSLQSTNARVYMRNPSCPTSAAKSNLFDW